METRCREINKIADIICQWLLKGLARGSKSNPWNLRYRVRECVRLCVCRRGGQCRRGLFPVSSLHASNTMSSVQIDFCSPNMRISLGSWIVLLWKHFARQFHLNTERDRPTPFDPNRERVQKVQNKGDDGRTRHANVQAAGRQLATKHFRVNLDPTMF